MGFPLTNLLLLEGGFWRSVNPFINRNFTPSMYLSFVDRSYTFTTVRLQFTESFTDSFIILRSRGSTSVISTIPFCLTFLL